MKERMLFRMPPPCTGDCFLAALATIQGYEQYLIAMHASDTDYEAEFFFVGDAELLDLIPKGNEPNIKWRTEDQDVPTSGLDLDLNFDIKAAFEISQAWKTHCTAAYGIMMGVEPPSIFPRLKHVEGIPETEDMLVLDAGFTDEELGSISDLSLSMGLQTTFVNPDYHGRNIGKAKSARVVVGQTSFMTYAAATLGKKVIELYPDSYMHLGWMAKWGRRPYYLVRQTLDAKRRHEVLLRAVRLACHEYRRVS